MMDMPEKASGSGIAQDGPTRALARFGETGCVDLAGICGYYSLLAMTMNVARVAPPKGEERLPRFPE